MRFTDTTSIGGRQAFLAMLGICLVIMLIALDQTVVGTAMPRIVAELKGFEYYSWVGSIYLLTSAIFIPLTGRLGDLYGRKPFILLAIVLFTGASTLCGAANTMLSLVVSRGIQGVGGGMLVGTVFASIADLFPDMARRIRWTMMATIAFGVANSIGPLLGGLLTEQWGWRSVFLVNLPVGVGAIWVVTRYMPYSKGVRNPGEKIDWFDALLLAVFLGSFLWVLENMGQWGYTSLVFWGVLIFSLAIGGWFGWRQTFVPTPLIPPRILSMTTPRQLCLLSILSGTVLFMLFFYVPLLLQGGLGYSPRTAGLILTPLAVGVPLGVFCNSQLLPRLTWGHRLLSCGFALLAITCLLITQMELASTQKWVALMGLCGFSFGFQLQNINLQMQAAVEEGDVGAGTALIFTFRMIGSMLAANLTSLIVNAHYATTVHPLLAGLGKKAAPIASLLSNPEILIRPMDEAALAKMLSGLRIDINSLLDPARAGLVGGINMAIYIAAVLAIIGMWVSWGLPKMVLKKETCSANVSIG